MDFSSIPIVSLMKSKMGYHSGRQGVLARNIANADTPDFKAQDVATPDFKQMISHSAHKLQLSSTNAMHMNAQTGQAGQFRVEKRKSTYELNPTGNNVSIEEEMGKMAENQIEYNKTLSLYRKTIDMFKTAIGKPGG